MPDNVTGRSSSRQSGFVSAAAAPARNRPTQAAADSLAPGLIALWPPSLIPARPLAPMLCALLLDVGQVLVEDDAVLARERDEALAAGSADERQPGLPRELDAPGG